LIVDPCDDLIWWTWGSGFDLFIPVFLVGMDNLSNLVGRTWDGCHYILGRIKSDQKHKRVSAWNWHF
jgi:hypothetical protein